MIQALPKIIPVNELKNTSQVMKTCQESEVPVVVTKNGYGECSQRRKRRLLSILPWTRSTRGRNPKAVKSFSGG